MSEEKIKDEVCGKCETDELSEVSHVVRVPHNYDESNVPVEILEITKNRNSLIRETKIVELSRKFKFDKYSFSRLTDNNIFEFTRNYLAAFVEGQCSHINGLTRTSCEIWLKNESLPHSAYFVFYFFFTHHYNSAGFTRVHYKNLNIRNSKI